MPLAYPVRKSDTNWASDLIAGGALCAIFAHTAATFLMLPVDPLPDGSPVAPPDVNALQNFESEPLAAVLVSAVLLAAVLLAGTVGGTDGTVLKLVRGRVAEDAEGSVPLGKVALAAVVGGLEIDPCGCGVPSLTLLHATVTTAAPSNPARDAPTRRAVDNMTIWIPLQVS